MKIKILGDKGDPLLLIHGWGVNSGIWVSLVDQLKKFFKIYIIDLPGMGESSIISPYTLENLANEIRVNIPVDKCNILGWSLGGQVAIQLAIKNPQFVEKLILMSTTPCFVERRDWPYGVKKQFFNKFEIDANNKIDDTLMKFFLIQTKDIVNAKDTMIFLKRNFIQSAQHKTHGMQNALGVLKNTDLRKDIKKINKKSLIIIGDKDRLTCPDASLWLNKNIKTSTLLTIQGANHMPFITHTKEVVDSMKEFINDN